MTILLLTSFLIYLLIHLRLCARMGVNAWLLTCQIILFFHLPLDVFSTALHIKLGLSHNVLKVSHYNCSQPLDPIRSTFFAMHVVEKKMTYIYEILLRPFRKMCDFMSHKGRPMSFCPMPYIFCIIKLTLCYQLMVYTH
jgi:hypothetical protein